MNKARITLRNSGSLFPSEWELIEEDAYWYSLYPLGREQYDIFLHACWMGTSGSYSFIVICCPNSLAEIHYDNFVSSSIENWTLSSLQDDLTEFAISMKSNWRTSISGSLEFSNEMFGCEYSSVL